jgi:hypothetical protein
MSVARSTSGFVVLALLVASSVTGCASLNPTLAFAPPPAANPLFVASNNEDAVWERTVDVVHEFHFPIARENRQSRVIETQYLVGASVFEPWHYDSVGVENRLESTLQSIRRKVLVNVIPDDQGRGYIVSVEAFKEQEDLPGLAANSAGGATFNENQPLNRDLNPVVGQSAPSGWIPVGRDLALENAILARLQQAYSTR